MEYPHRARKSRFGECVDSVGRFARERAFFLSLLILFPRSLIVAQEPEDGEGQGGRRSTTEKGGDACFVVAARNFERKERRPRAYPRRQYSSPRLGSCRLVSTVRRQVYRGSMLRQSRVDGEASTAEGKLSSHLGLKIYRGSVLRQSRVAGEVSTAECELARTSASRFFFSAQCSGRAESLAR